jgi:TetR/AcrR family transcriptional repressor of mexCD-oprJ operon
MATDPQPATPTPMAAQQAPKKPRGKPSENGSTVRRADAERNIAAIIGASVELLSVDPNVSMAEIARRAGVGRVTLYAHFASRQALVEAVVTSAIGDAESALIDAHLDALPADAAIEVLLRTCWDVLDRFRRIRIAARAELGEEQLRQTHGRAFAHVEPLISRGCRDGVFRTDLPQQWLVATFYALLHAASEEVQAGRLQRSNVPTLLSATVLPLLRRPVPSVDSQ